MADQGREIVRVDRSGPDGDIRAVPDAELTQVGGASYFRDTLRLGSAEIYVSPVRLSAVAGRKAAAPILRMAAPVFAGESGSFGIVVIDVDMSRPLDNVRRSVSPGEQAYVVDAKGSYLVHPDRAREFAGEKGEPGSWQTDLPELAAASGTAQRISRITADGKGQPKGMALALTPALLAGSEWIGVVEAVPSAVFMAPAAAIRTSSIGVGLVAVIVAALLAVLIARSLTRPITQLTTAVEAVGQTGTAVIRVDAPGETGVLARAFVRVMEEASAKTAALEREVVEHLRTEAARDRYAERERLFSAAVESSNDAIVTKSLEGVITGWNPAAQRLFGYTAEEAVGQHISLIVPTERRAEVDDILRRIRWGEGINHNETVRVRKDGTRVDVSLSLSPIKSASGAIIGVSKTARDITERNRTQRALRQQNEERRRIFETSQDLIMIVDSRGSLVQVSPSSEAILGYRPSEMIGRSPAHFMHPDHIENTREQLRALRRGERPKIADSRFIHRAGREVWLSWLGAWSEPVKRYFFVGRDMTETHKAQETLRESERLARGILTSALDAFVQIDQHGIIREWNPQAEAIFGWPRGDALGQNVFDLLSRQPGRQGPLRTALADFLHSGLEQLRLPRREIVARRRDGKEITAELSAAALKTRDGIVFNGFIRDLTDKIAAEERIRQAEKMEAMGQLTGGIAHDFNNILTVITGTIEILADAVDGEPQLAAITRMIDEAASRGADLTQQLLAFARKQPLEPRETDVNVLIIETAKLLQRTLGEHVETASVFESESCLAIVDPNQLATAILNLALNARDAMPEGGKLVIETGHVELDESYAELQDDLAAGRYAMIAVSDTGTGIPASIIDKVFNPFFTSKGPGKGTGLGLSMVYGFVKQSAGHIKIYSEEGHGTTVRMYLPAASGILAPSEVAPAIEFTGGHETILVVEDDKLVRNYVLTQLHSLGYVTLEAANATDALAIARSEQPFDLLFTDVIMPGMNGKQLADEVAKIRPGARVLFTSGYTEDAIIHHGRLDEGVLLLAKPYRKSDLAAMIRKALGD